MSCFVDTSAFYALLDRDDANHGKAKKLWQTLLSEDRSLVTTNYVLVESFALIQHCLGLDAVRGFQENVLPVVNVEWIKEAVHRSAVSALLAAGKRRLSPVDCSSFEIMRMLGIRNVFAFDPHFSEQGFTGPAPRA